MSNAVTLCRIANSHPEIIAGLCVRGIDRFLSIGENLSVYLKFPGAACLIPRERRDLSQAYLEFCIEVDKLINPGRKTELDKLKTYWEAAHSSVMFSDDTRSALLDRFEVMLPKDILMSTSEKSDKSGTKIPSTSLSPKSMTKRQK